MGSGLGAIGTVRSLMIIHTADLTVHGIQMDGKTWLVDDRRMDSAEERVCDVGEK